MLDYDLKIVYTWPWPAKFFVIGMFCALILYMGYFFDITNLARTLRGIKQQELDVKQQFITVFNQQSVLEGDVAALPKLKDLLINWQRKLIQPSALPELLNEILKIGTSNQVQFNLFTPLSEEKEGIYNKVPIKVVIVGGYNQIAGFISQVANMPWIVVIGNFTLSKEKQDTKTVKETGNEHLLTADLMLEVYYLAKK